MFDIVQSSYLNLEYYPNDIHGSCHVTHSNLHSGPTEDGHPIWPLTPATPTTPPPLTPTFQSQQRQRFPPPPSYPGHVVYPSIPPGHAHHTEHMVLPPDSMVSSLLYYMLIVELVNIIIVVSIQVYHPELGGATLLSPVGPTPPNSVYMPQSVTPPENHECGVRTPVGNPERQLVSSHCHTHTHTAHTHTHTHTRSHTLTHTQAHTHTQTHTHTHTPPPHTHTHTHSHTCTHTLTHTITLTRNRSHTHTLTHTHTHTHTDIPLTRRRS